MKKLMVLGLLVWTALLCAAEDKARVFITDSTSWEVNGQAGGAGGAFGSSVHGGARPQTAEIIKTFGERCPNVMVNNRQEKADYIVLLDHEGGKGLLRHKNKVAVFNRETGDSIVSHSTLSLGGSVEEACKAILKNWAEHSATVRSLNTSTAPESKSGSAPAPEMSKTDPSARLAIASNPVGADIEIDGNFVGNTPSNLELPSGEHTISVKKSGFKEWQRKIKVTGGEVKISAELERSGSQ
ncbi:MAG TPA: PEGA domain-containing protein [Candidatus Sulfotelmatobacter sp.]|nr:PEGA domain-containing protein [Candidatus Sulfotelmatobacter sp.]